MVSNERNAGEKAKKLFPIERVKHKNISHLVAYTNGFIELGAVSLSDGSRAIGTVCNEYSDFFERGKPMQLENIFNAAREQISQLAKIPINHHYTPRQRGEHFGIELRDEIQEQRDAKRVIVQDQEDFFLIVDFIYSESGRVRPIVRDPYNSNKREEKRNRWFNHVLQQGYWVLSTNPLEADSISDSSLEVEVVNFPKIKL